MRRKGLRLRLQESVMKFGYAWPSDNKPRGGTPALPPEERAAALPRRRVARGIRIGLPHPNWPVSACWGLQKLVSRIGVERAKRHALPGTLGKNALSQPISVSLWRQTRVYCAQSILATYYGKLNMRRRRGMVNVGVVNARVSCFLRATFCESFPVLGRIPRFQNPVKYRRRFDINHETVHFLPGSGAPPLMLSVLYQ